MTTRRASWPDAADMRSRRGRLSADRFDPRAKRRRNRDGMDLSVAFTHQARPRLHAAGNENCVAMEEMRHDETAIAPLGHFDRMPHPIAVADRSVKLAGTRQQGGAQEPELLRLDPLV